MVNETLFNSTELFEQITEPLMEMFSPLVTIFKAVGIVVLVYVAFLLFKALLRFRDSGRLKRISKELSEMNRKMDVLLQHFKDKKEKGKKQRDKERG